MCLPCYLQITHMQDFKYWEIFYGLTVEQMKERQRNFEYPPRLKINCEQIDASKPLCSSFKVSKRGKGEETPIAEFPLFKGLRVSGT